eukprot:scaffold5215_cov181-Amphora_coffeaeformis.AAC.10
MTFNSLRFNCLPTDAKKKKRQAGRCCGIVDDSFYIFMTHNVVVNLRGQEGKNPPSFPSAAGTQSAPPRQERREDEIEQLIQDRAHHRLRGRWDEADRIKRKLEQEYGVELMDRADPFETTWIPRLVPEKPRVIEWYAALETMLTPTVTSAVFLKEPIAFIINTVDTPYYRQRYRETREYLEQWQLNGTIEVDCFRFQKCDLLDLETHASIGAKGILMQGWKAVLIPTLLQLQQAISPTYDASRKDMEFVLVAEDDIRFPASVTPTFLRSVCTHAFASHPHVLVLSLGHSWSTLQKSKEANNNDEQPSDENMEQKNSLLLNFLRHKPVGIHATTLLALRYPAGVQAVQKAFDSTSKLQHLDQFLFHSTQHSVPLAVSDPPLAGWVEVEQSLTKSGSGYRRLGGGRLGHVPGIGAPSQLGKIQWIQRRVKEQTGTE